MQKQQVKNENFWINYDEQKLPTKQSRTQYIFNLLKQSNPFVHNRQTLTMTDLLLGELQLYMQQKENISEKRLKQIMQLEAEFDKLGQQIIDQKSLTVKYEERLQKYLSKIQKQAQSQLVQLTKERIKRQIEFAQKIDQQLIKLTTSIRQNRLQKGQLNEQSNLDSPINLVEQKLTKIKAKSHELSINIIQKQNELTNLINSKVSSINLSMNKLKSESNKFNDLLYQIQEFQKFVIGKIRKMKDERTQKQQLFIQIVEKIVGVIDKKSFE